MKVCEGTLLSSVMLTETCCDMRILAPEIANALPGQFVHVKCEGFTLRRPISVCDTDGDTLRLIVDRRGAGTEWLVNRKKFDTLDILGPIGRGFETSDKILVVGGGIGTPPLLMAAKAAGEAHAILGYRSQSAVMLVDDFNAACKTVQVATDDGTFGFHGRVDAVLRKRLNIEKFDRVLACGPTPMLKAVTTVCKEAGVPLQVSLEERMGCGIGACLVCACKLRVNDGGEWRYGHVCKDGPVFDAEEVEWE